MLLLVQGKISGLLLSLSLDLSLLRGGLGLADAFGHDVLEGCFASRPSSPNPRISGDVVHVVGGCACVCGPGHPSGK